MTTKTTKTILFTSLIAITMIVSLTTVNFSHAQTASVDKTDYFAAAVVAFEAKQELEKQIESDQVNISELEKRLENTTDQIERLSISSELKQQNALITVKELKVDEITNEIDRLEQLNIQAHKVDEQTKRNYMAIEEAIRTKYLNELSPKFVGDNPVEMVLVETQFKELVIMVNPNEITENGLNVEDLRKEYYNTVKNMPGNDLTIELEIGSIEKIACSARDTDCRPLLGGLTVANEDETGDANLGTLGYEAKNGSTEGFIITGHQAGAYGKDIIQPHDDATKIVGVVDIHQENAACDCAFVDVSSGISVNNEIYKSSNNVYTVTGEVAGASQTLNTWVYKSGAKTAVTLGQIKGINTNENLLYIYHGKGDSGSPVFDITSGDNVDLYGMINGGRITPGLGYATYHTWDHINDELGTSLP